jgi:hypothetical protein
MRPTRWRTRALALAALSAALLGLVTPAHAGIVPPCCPDCHPQPRQTQHHPHDSLPPKHEVKDGLSVFASSRSPVGCPSLFLLVMIRLRPTRSRQRYHPARGAPPGPQRPLRRRLYRVRHGSMCRLSEGVHRCVSPDGAPAPSPWPR